MRKKDQRLIFKVFGQSKFIHPSSTTLPCHHQIGANLFVLVASEGMKLQGFWCLCSTQVSLLTPFFCLHVFRRTLSCHFWRLQRPKAYPQSGVISKESVFNQVASHTKNETAFLPQTVRLYNSKFKTWCSSYTFVCNKREHHCAHMTIVS